MNIQAILHSKFNVPRGTKIVAFENGVFGAEFGGVTTSSGGEVEGHNLLTSIQVASRQVASIQAAIDAMQAILDGGPIKPQEPTE